jgi:hypothetical protein
VSRLEEVPLVPGEYLLTLGCLSGERQLDLLEHVASFSVEPRDFFKSGFLPHQLNGPVLIRAQWDVSDAGLEVANSNGMRRVAAPGSPR